jgi:hypothetical protein
MERLEDNGQGRSISEKWVSKGKQTARQVKLLTRQRLESSSSRACPEVNRPHRFSQKQIRVGNEINHSKDSVMDPSLRIIVLGFERNSIFDNSTPRKEGGFQKTISFQASFKSMESSNKIQ